MERRFTALRIIGTVLKIIAWLMLILGILGAIGLLIASFALTDQLGISELNVGGPLAGIAGFVVTLVIAILQFLSLYAGGEFIYLFLAIEENTRRTAYFVQQQYTGRQPGYAPTAIAPDYGD